MFELLMLFKSGGLIGELVLFIIGIL